MSASTASVNKTKIARRVIEILDNIDSGSDEIAVMDIVRCFHRPQSSTSELLASLGEIGILHKDPLARTYRVTPRAAFVGQTCQPQNVRDGTLVRIIEQLHARTGLEAALYAMVGVSVQIVTLRGTRAVSARKSRFRCGAKEPMVHNAPGCTLLSSIAQPRRSGLVRRLNSEADENSKFAPGEMERQLEDITSRGYALGPAGFGVCAKTLSVLLPGQPSGRPLAVGLTAMGSEKIRAEEVFDEVRDAISASISSPPNLSAAVDRNDDLESDDAMLEILGAS